VTGTMEFYDFPIILGIIIPTDELIFFRGVGQPPTRNAGFSRQAMVDYRRVIIFPQSSPSYKST